MGWALTMWDVNQHYTNDKDKIIMLSINYVGCKYNKLEFCGWYSERWALTMWDVNRRAEFLVAIGFISWALTMWDVNVLFYPPCILFQGVEH